MEVEGIQELKGITVNALHGFMPSMLEIAQRFQDHG